jgi:hypothetical protein
VADVPRADRVEVLDVLTRVAKVYGWRPVSAESSDRRIVLTIEPRRD